MYNTLKLIFEQNINNTQLQHKRYLYPNFELQARLTGLLGARGVGKTTLLLQFIKENFPHPGPAFYFSADHISFSETKLYYFVEELYLKMGIRYVFIDEIHKYANWSQELKNLYDGFPDLYIIFSGSSSLDLIKGSYDLSRRAKLFTLSGLSLREYIYFETSTNLPTISLTDLLSKPENYNAMLANTPKLLGYFEVYLKHAFYPFYYESPLAYYEQLLRVIEKTIYEDIASFYNYKTTNLQNFKRILMFLASIPPGEANINNIAKNLFIDTKTVSQYLSSLEATGLVNLVYTAQSGNAILRRPNKIFLSNTNLQYALENTIATQIDLGTIRELFFIQSLRSANYEVFYSKQGDYQVLDSIFEIGGQNKTRQQIKGYDKAFLVKDDILLASTNVIPLLLFGFLY